MSADPWQFGPFERALLGLILTLLAGFATATMNMVVVEHTNPGPDWAIATDVISAAFLASILILVLGRPLFYAFLKIGRQVYGTVKA